jgi:hypothetical protein
LCEQMWPASLVALLSHLPPSWFIVNGERSQRPHSITTIYIMCFVWWVDDQCRGLLGAPSNSAGGTLTSGRPSLDGSYFRRNLIGYDFGTVAVVYNLSRPRICQQVLRSGLRIHIHIHTCSACYVVTLSCVGRTRLCRQVLDSGPPLELLRAGPHCQPSDVRLYAEFGGSLFIIHKF